MLGANGQTPAGNMTGGPPPGSNLHGGSMADGALSNQMDRDTAAQVPQLAAQIPNEPVAGPYLQFINYNPQQYLWRGSALISMHSSVQGSPSVTLTDRDGPRQAPVSPLASSSCPSHASLLDASPKTGLSTLSPTGVSLQWRIIEQAALTSMGREEAPQHLQLSPAHPAHPSDAPTLCYLRAS